MYGIDVVSTAPVDWGRVRESGRTFAYLRSAYGRAVDPGFGTSWGAMRDAGIVRGAWQVLRHDEDPVEQAVQFLKVVQLQRGDLPPMLDLERMSTTSPTQVVAMVKTWASVVESELDARHGCAPRAIIRTSSRACPVRCEPNGFERHALWVIDPTRFDQPEVPRCWGTGEWTMHQYAVGKQGIPGVAGTAQLDRFQPVALGARGRRVELVKELLREANFGFGITETAELDEYTSKAITSFQAARGLVQDGIVGPKTFAELHWP
jgi:lysozyme